MEKIWSICFLGEVVTLELQIFESLAFQLAGAASLHTKNKYIK